MAISASTVGSNRIVKSILPKSVFDDAKAVISSAISFFQGDLMYLDTTNHLIKRVAATGDAATFIGIADESISSGKLLGPYTGLTLTDAAEAIGPVQGPKSGVIASMKLKSGDAFVPGGLVYLADGQDCQTVSSVDPGDHFHIGIFQDAAVTAGAGSVGKVLIGSRYGADINV
jgi:hypothetical protein